jgi:hypothetical protein
MTRPDENESIDYIRGERRGNRRYRIALDLQWNVVRRRRVLDSGTGRTLDLSSGGILFDAGRQLQHGMTVEMSIAWPALLHDVAPLQLVISGRVVRSDGPRIAVNVLQHEFRTAGTAHDQRLRMQRAAGVDMRPVLASVAKFGTNG